MELRRAWGLDPQGWIAAALLGQLALSERRFADTRDWCGKADPAIKQRGGLVHVGVIPWQQGLRNEAIADFEKSVSLDPLHTRAMAYLSHMTGGEWLERLYNARSERAQAFLAAEESVVIAAIRTGS
jgi:hypothetical protein